MVGQAHVQGVAVRIGVDRNGLDSFVLAGADNSHRDFTAVGDQDFFHSRALSVAAGEPSGLDPTGQST